MFDSSKFYQKYRSWTQHFTTFQSRTPLWISDIFFSYLSIRLTFASVEKLFEVFSLNLNSKDTRDNCSPVAIHSKRRFSPFSPFFGILSGGEDRRPLWMKNRWLKFNFGTIGRVSAKMTRCILIGWNNFESDD